MSEINASNFKKKHGDLAPDLVGVTELTSPIYFVPPSGNTAERPSDCEPGTLRFNTDIGNLEVFRGKNIGWESIERGEGQYLGGSNAAQSGSNKGTGVRGLAMSSTDGGATQSDTIEFITISTLGNSQDFGNLTIGARQGTGFSSRTRALQAGGYDGSSRHNRIDFVTIASLGNASDFGDLQETRIGNPSGISNQIRGLVAAGENPGNTNDIDYITIASNGNAVDFGHLSNAYQTGFAAGSTTRGIFAGGRGTPGYYNVIEFVTFTTTGDVTDFGDLSSPKKGSGKGNSSNSTRAIFCGEDKSGDTITNVIEFITIATTGNATDFGDATSNITTVANLYSSTRGVHSGGYNGSSNVNSIQFVEIATTGNAQDFGDCTLTNASRTGASSGHGGL